MVTEIELFESPDLTLLDFYWCRIKSEFYKRKVATLDELLARILDAVGCKKKREDQLRRTTRDLHTRVAKCPEADGGVFEHLL
jgi:hypothetical protein